MKPFSNPPEIEELSELTWKRVEGQLIETLSLEEEVENSSRTSGRRSKRLLWALLSGAGLVAAAAFLLIHYSSPDSPESSDAVAREQEKGTVDTKRVQEENALVSTHEEVLALEIGTASVEIAANSSLTVAEKGDVVSLSLQAGGLSVNVEKGEVVVQAGVVKIRAQNSSFSVYRTELGSDIEVVRGMLTVQNGDNEFVLRAKAHWPEPKEDVSISSVESVTKDGGTQAKSPRALFEEGQRMEASRPKSAIVAYRKAWAQSGPWAANALYAHARLEAARGNWAKAKRLVGKYLGRFPKGANAQDAKQLLRTSGAQ